MSASVSSEWAFSSCGITVSKQWNQLKGVIVEVLQCVKCSLHHDLLFHKTGLSLLTEDNKSKAKDEARENSVGNSEDEEEGWDTLILEDSDDEDDEDNGANGADENNDEYKIEM
jgi:hypothetical protein